MRSLAPLAAAYANLRGWQTRCSLLFLSPPFSNTPCSPGPWLLQTLKGAVIFLADLVRDIYPVPDGMQLDFLRASSYGSGTASSGKVAISDVGGSQGVAGRHVLLVSALH